MTFEVARQVLVQAIADHAFPGAALEVGTAEHAIWNESLGTLTYDDRSAPVAAATAYDLASLTKVIATTTLVMALVDAGRIHLDDPVARWVPAWGMPGRSAVTIEHLLAHASGLPAWLPLFRDHHGRNEFVSTISAIPLDYVPGSQSIYSDLGFILLGAIIEEREGLGLDDLFANICSRFALNDVTYLPPASWRARTAPTEYDPIRGRMLIGEVHDENAAALNGVAGHAGLFGTASGVGRFARDILRARIGAGSGEWAARRETVLAFTARHEVPGSSRALGWDTMLPTSSCGTRMSSSAFGHVGFTGTSLWIDPVLNLYVVLLTNRVYPTRENNRMTEVRPAFHDAVVQAVKAER